MTLLLLAGTFGFVLRSFLPPFVLDDPFWRDVLSGPPVAGLFALVGAGVAFAAAAIAARTAKEAAAVTAQTSKDAAHVAATTSRENARRQEWWDRTEWALSQVMSTDPVARTIGLETAVLLTAEATTAEAAMIDAVTSRFLPPPPPPSAGA